MTTQREIDWDRIDAAICRSASLPKYLDRAGCAKVVEDYFGVVEAYAAGKTATEIADSQGWERHAVEAVIRVAARFIR